MNGVSTITRHSLTSRLSRLFAALLAVFAVMVVNITNANPASADLGIPNWAKVSLPASIARTAGSVGNTVISVAEALPDAAGAITLTASENAAFDALAASAAAGTAATCPVWCVVAGTALGVGAVGYGLYKFATIDGPECAANHARCPDSDVVPPSSGPAGHWANDAGQNCTHPTTYRLSCGDSQRYVDLIAAPSAGATTGLIKFNSIRPYQGGYYDAVVTTAGGSHYAAGTSYVACPGGQIETCIEISSNRATPDGTAMVSLDFSSSGLALDRWIIGTPVAPASPGATPPSPDRQAVEERVCKNTAGTPTTVTATGATYKEAWGRAIVKHAQCPAGTATDSVTVKAHTLDGSAPDKVLSTVARPSTVAVGTNPDPLILYITLPDGTTQSCEQTPSPCAHWYESPTKNDTYTCKQGGVILALAECDGLANRYNPVDTPVNSTTCWSGFSFNPVSWVITPLKCLFIPSSDAMARWKAQVTGISQTGVIALPVTIGNFVTAVLTAGSNAYTCPSEAAGTYSDGTTIVTKTSPIHWCQIIQNAGDQTQSTTWGMVLFNGARIILFVFFGLVWYNRITATAGSQAAI